MKRREKPLEEINVLLPPRIVREPLVRVQGSMQSLFAKAHVAAKRALSLFTKIRCCSLFIAGFAVIGGSSVGPMIWGSFNEAKRFTVLLQ